MAAYIVQGHDLSIEPGDGQLFTQKRDWPWMSVGEFGNGQDGMPEWAETRVVRIDGRLAGTFLFLW